MNQAQLKVLQLVADHTITAAEAETLLDAMEDPAEAAPAPEPAQIIPAAPPSPDKPGWAAHWLFPLVSGLVLASVGFGYTVMAVLGLISWLWLFLTVFVWLVGCVLIVLAWFSQSSKWLHIKVKNERERINISLPLPPGLIGWALKIARPFIPNANQDIISDVFETPVEELWADGFWVEVDEVNGEQVKIIYA